MATKAEIALGASIISVIIIISTLYATTKATPKAIAAQAMTLQAADELMRSASNNKISAESIFPGPDGMTGVVMKSPTGRGISWLPAGGKTILIGLALDSQGKNMSLAAHEKYIGAFAAAESTNHTNTENLKSDVLELVDQLPFIAMGNSQATKELYIFSDLNCHYCEDLYRLISQMDTSDIAIKWLPVGALGKASQDQAATLLSAPKENQSALLEKHHGALHEPIEAMNSSHPNYNSLSEALEKSRDMLAKLGEGTPLLLYWNGESIDIIPKSPTRDELAVAIKKIKAR